MKGGERMNIDALLFTSQPKLGQSTRSIVSSSHQTSFEDVIDHITERKIDDPELIQSGEDKLVGWLEDLSDEELKFLVGWFADEFDLEFDDKEQVIAKLKEFEEIDIDQESQEIQVLFGLIQLLDIQAERIDHFQYVTPNLNPVTNLSSMVNDSQINNDSLVDALNQLINTFDAFTQEDAKQLLNLLKQMQEPNQTLTTILDQLEGGDSSKTDLDILIKVHDNFQNKFALAQKTSYQSDTTVTSKDVLKWVEGAIEQIKGQGEQEGNTFGQLFSQQRTDTAIEQLQIQLANQVQTPEQMGEELISKFEKAISQSTFLQGKDGSQQLLLKLAPDSLGTILVELTEIDGEMLVKLTASSQMAKEALEANIKELRHMFAPQNVVIEKQESQPIFVEQQSPFEQPQDEQELNEQEQQQTPNEQDHHDEDSIRFEDVLFQERV